MKLLHHKTIQEALANDAVECIAAPGLHEMWFTDLEDGFGAYCDIRSKCLHFEIEEEVASDEVQRILVQCKGYAVLSYGGGQDLEMYKDGVLLCKCYMSRGTCIFN